MLQIYLDDKQWDLSGFVDLILGQTTVGTVVKIEGDEENTIWSIVTALNLYRYKASTCTAISNYHYLQLLAHILAHNSSLKTLSYILSP